MEGQRRRNLGEEDEPRMVNRFAEEGILEVGELRMRRIERVEDEKGKNIEEGRRIGGRTGKEIMRGIRLLLEHWLMMDSAMRFRIMRRKRRRNKMERR